LPASGVCSARQQPPLPEFELRVEEISGQPLYQGPEQTSFSPLREGQIVEEGGLLQNRRGKTSLTIAGSLHLVIENETKVIFDQLQQSFKTRGLLLAREEYTLRQIELELIKGDIRARTRHHDNVSTDFRVKTLTAVAGIRGTTIHCSSDFKGKTTVKVLDGYLSFYNRFQPEYKTLLGPGFQSSISSKEDRPSEPTPLTSEETEKLYEFRKTASSHLLMPPYLKTMKLNKKSFDFRNGKFSIVHNYPRPDTLILSGEAKVREQRAAISEIDVLIHGHRTQPAGIENWELPFTITPPPEKEKIDITGQVTVHDDLGSASHPRPFEITLFHPEEEKTIPEDLLEGNVPVVIEQIGKTDPENIVFPHKISSLELRRLPWEGHSDTGPLAYPGGIRITGRVNTDSPVAGVAYSLDGGYDWEKTKGEKNWELTVPDSLLRKRKKVTVKIVAWTRDGYIGDGISIGPFVFKKTELAYPFEYPIGELRPRITSVGPLTEPDFPLEINNAQLAGEKLTVRGQIKAETEIAGAVYRVNKEHWLKPRGTKNWEFDLPSGRSNNFFLEIIAWTTDGFISRPLTAEINFDYQEPTLPRDYKRTVMPLKVRSIASFPVDELEFPFHTYRDDAEANGLAVRGNIEVDTPLEGMAISLDGGKSWDRINPDRDWIFTLPHKISRSFDKIQLLAWTVDGRISPPLKLETIEHSRQTINNALRQQFATFWRAFESRDLRRILEKLDSQFIFRDNESGAYKEKDEFRWFLKDLFREIRNLNVNYSVKNVRSGAEFAVLNSQLEWKGLFDRPNMPFIMFGRDVSFDFERKSNGLFTMKSMRNFPPVVFLFNRRGIRIPDFGGISLEELAVSRSTSDVDILAEVTTPDLTANYATLGLGGDIVAGGIMELRAHRFSSVRSIPDIDRGYRRNQAISRGEFYAVNIENNFGDPATALIKIVAIRPDYIEIQIISGRPAPGEQQRAITDYREVDPFE
jgi:hypothetical protein